MKNWIFANRKWLFSGVGVVLISAIGTFVWQKLLMNDTDKSGHNSQTQEQNSTGSVINIQVQEIPGKVNISVPQDSDSDNSKKKLEELHSVSYFIYRPIKNIDILLNSFKLPQGQENVQVRFISTNWGIDLPVSVSKDIKLKSIKDNLLQHFPFEDHIIVPFPKEIAHEYWELQVNSKSVKEELSLKEIGIQDNDVLKFKIRLVYDEINASGTR